MTRYIFGAAMTKVTGSVSFLATVVVAFGLLVLPFPCPDDLLVALGGPDRCVAQTPGDSSPSPDAPAHCPCACHVPMATGPAAPAAPMLLVAELETLNPLGVLAAVSTPTTPPPLA